MSPLLQQPVRISEPDDEPVLGQRFLLHDISWEGYEKILEALAESHVRVTYDRGDLELMSPLPIHEAVKVRLRQFIDVLAEELDIDIDCMGSTTFRRRDVLKGLEPDECFYFASGSKIRDWLTLNLERDPPPDLVLEVDVTNSSLDRMSIYAALKVPEIWRYEGDEVLAYRLGPNGKYQRTETSVSLPFLSLADLTALLKEVLGSQERNRKRIQRFRSWCREYLLPLKKKSEKRRR